MPAHIPSPTAVESGDEGQLPSDLQLVRVRSQVAIIRTLADRAERLARPIEADELDEHLVEEMAALGCRLLEAAASLTALRRCGESGIFALQDLEGMPRPQ
jgi:hypothetical protein